MVQRYKYDAMILIIRWIRLVFGYIFYAAVLFCAINYKTAIYLIYQIEGQLFVLRNTQTVENYRALIKLSTLEKNNLLLVEKIKSFSVDSLGYQPTNNFTQIYNQKSSPVLWVITASEPFVLKAYEWKFPIVGKVSYKGFFDKSLALREFNYLTSLGFDVDLRSVSAWSTLGWFSDPLMSSALNRQKGSLCNLLFHELFHSTFYAKNAVDFNENIASFIAHKATLQFLKNDTFDLNLYINSYSDNKIYTNYIIRKTTVLNNFYKNIIDKKDRQFQKLKVLHEILDSIKYLPLKNRAVFDSKKSDILKSKNAYFIDFEQYDSMQDSLEVVFNKFYNSNIRNLVRDLRQGKTIVKFDN